MPSETPILPRRLLQWAKSHPIECGLLGLFVLIVTGFYLLYPVGEQGLSTLQMLVSSWNEETDYGHGYMVGPLILGLVVWRFWKTPVGPRDPATAKYGLVVFIFGILLWIAAYRVLQWRMAVGSLCFVVWGAIWYLLGWRAAKLTFLPVFLLALAVPVPGMIQATNGLQVVATKLGYLGSKLFGVDCLQSGTNIQSTVAGKWGFDIAEGCSGVRSLMAMVLIAAVYVYIIDLPLWRKALVFIAAIPLAIAVNAIRIITILVLAEYFSKEFAGGIYHDYASFFIFPLGLLGMVGVHQLLTLDQRVKRRVVRRMNVPESNPV